jgi:hypothetical protein
MLEKPFAALCLATTLSLAFAGCGKPKQAEAPDAFSDKGADMATGHEDKGGDVKAVPGEKSGAEQLREKCCGQCKDGMKKDRSGAKPETTPCADFTDTLDVFCLEHFRGKPAMAAACMK